MTLLKIQKVTLFLIAIFSSTIIFSFLTLSLGVNPATDDYRGMLHNKTYSMTEAWNYMLNLYFTWEGRYTHFFLVKYAPSIYYHLGITDNYYVVKIQALLTNSFFIISLYLFFSLFFENKLIRYILISIFLFYTGTFEAFYWFSASISYSMGMAMFFLFLYFFNKINKHILYVVLCSILVFFGSGQGQIVAIINLVYPLGLLTSLLLFRSLAPQHLPNDINYKRLSFIILIATISFLIVFLSPGASNRIKIEGFSVLDNLKSLLTIHGIKDYIRNYWFTLISNYFRYTFLLIALVFILFFNTLKIRLSLFQSFYYFFSTLIAFIITSTFLYLIYKYQYFLISRVYFFVFSILFILIVTFFTVILKHTSINHFLRKRFIWLSVFTIIIMPFFFGHYFTENFLNYKHGLESINKQNSWYKTVDSELRAIDNKAEKEGRVIPVLVRCNPELIYGSFGCGYCPYNVIFSQVYPHLTPSQYFDTKVFSGTSYPMTSPLSEEEKKQGLSYVQIKEK